MKTSLIILALFCGLISNLHAQQKPQPPKDPFSDNLFPPEFILHMGDDLGLTASQRDFFKKEAREAEPKFAALQEKLDKETAATAKLLEQPKVDEKTILAQFDKLLNQEREIKRAHLTLVLSFKNKLTEEQQKKLKGLKKKMEAMQPPPSLQTVMQKLEAAIKEAEGEGRDLSEVGNLMQDFDPLMKEGAFKEAEALALQALKAAQSAK